MQEVFEKIVEKLEENQTIVFNLGGGKPKQSIDIERAIEIVKQEVEKYNSGWIPCSVVDHPEHCNDCEVTMLDTHGYTRDIAFYTDKWRRTSDEAAVTVIAWKEPSQPYQPKGE